MKMNKFIIDKKEIILFFSIFLLVLRDFIRVVLGKYVYTSEGWLFEKYTGSIMSICIIISLILLVIYVFNYCKIKVLPQWVRLSLYTTGLLTIFWTFHSLFTIKEYSISTFDGTAKTIFFMMFGIFIGHNLEAWEKIYRYIPLVTLIYIIISAYYVVLVQLGDISGNIINESPYWMVYSGGFWVFAYYLLCFKEKTIRVTFILMILNLIIVSFTISRGWLIQTLFLYCVFFLSSSTFSIKKKYFFVLLFIISIGIGTYLMREKLLDAYFAYSIKFKSLGSRTNQYDTFFSQVNIFELFIGKGEYASYLYKSNPNYIYIDNSYLYYAFHFGLLFAIIMLFLPLKAGIDVLKCKCVEKKIGLILLMWIVALNGVSVFCAGYEISFRLLFIMILIGRAIYIKQYNISY